MNSEYKRNTEDLEGDSDSANKERKTSKINRVLLTQGGTQNFLQAIETFNLIPSMYHSLNMKENQNHRTSSRLVRSAKQYRNHQNIFLIFILFGVFLRIYNCISTCSGDIFPIVHGGYFTGDSGDLQDYEFCHIEYAYVNGLSVFSNGDLLLLYIVNIDNLDYQFSFGLDATGLLVRMDSITGRTIWARDIVLNTGNALLKVYGFSIKDDLIWCMITNYQSLNYFGIIAQLDFEGNIIQSFSVVNKIDAAQNDIKFFVPEFIDVADDHSIILLSEATFYPNSIGVSIDSQVDISILKFSTNQNVEWSTSLDYNNLIEHASYIEIFNQSVYLSFNSADLYLCICKLSLNDGSYQSSSLIQTIQKVPYKNGRFAIIMIDSSFIFAYDYYEQFGGCNQLLIFDTTNK